MKIVIVGAGYVGMSLGVLLSQNSEVVLYDISPQKVDMINKKISPMNDSDIIDFFKNRKLNITATEKFMESLKNTDYVIICTPTDFDENLKCFNTRNVIGVLEKLNKYNYEGGIVIKSTVPIGFTEEMKRRFSNNKIIFSSEFLREDKALYDNLYPSRIIIGDETELGKNFAQLLLNASYKKDIDIKYMSSTEAEAVKLFSNTYLALRVAYFNELDTYAEINNLNTKNIIDGVCLDSRIGNYYNNPSFGYGGYCLPKDTKQLLANYENIPENIVEAVVRSNVIRKKHIAKMILKKNVQTVGIYKLSMKSNSDNYRASAVIDIINILRENNIDIIIYDPNIKDNDPLLKKCKYITDLNELKKNSQLIIANRIDKDILDVFEKVYTRDIFSRD